MTKYRTRYVWTNRAGRPHHSYELVGEKGGLHLHIDENGGREHIVEDFTAGLEVHERQGSGAPSHDECWLIKAPCWHDGTTMYAEEHFLPKVLRADFDPSIVLRLLEEEADRRWGRPTKDGDAA